MAGNHKKPEYALRQHVKDDNFRSIKLALGLALSPKGCLSAWQPVCADAAARRHLPALWLAVASLRL